MRGGPQKYENIKSEILSRRGFYMGSAVPIIPAGHRRILDTVNLGTVRMVSVRVAILPVGSCSVMTVREVGTATVRL